MPITRMKRRTFVNAAVSVTATITLAGCTDRFEFGGNDSGSGGNNSKSRGNNSGSGGNDSLPVSVDNRDDVTHTVTVTITQGDISDGEPTFEESVEIPPEERVKVTQIDGVDYSITARSDTGRESQNNPSSSAEAVIIYIGDGGKVEITSLGTN